MLRDQLTSSIADIQKLHTSSDLGIGMLSPQERNGFLYRFSALAKAFSLQLTRDNLHTLQHLINDMTDVVEFSGTNHSSTAPQAGYFAAYLNWHFLPVQ